MRPLACLCLGSAVALVAACASESPTGLDIPPGGSVTGGSGGAGGAGGGPGASAQDTYVNTVHDDLVQACGSCHSQGVQGAPIFMNSDDALSSYQSLVDYPGLVTPPNNSNLVLKGEHTGPGLDSNAVPAGLYDNTVAWLEQEALERGLGSGTGGAGGGTGGATFDTAMDDFASCMRYDVWLGVGMEVVPLQQTDGSGPCSGCHNNGVGGLTLDGGDSQLTFEATKQKHNLLKYVAPYYDDNGNFVKLVPSNRLLEKPGEECLFDDPEDCHPNYVLDTNAVDAITGFVDHTLDALENGTCDEPYGGAGGSGGGGA